MRHWLRTHGWLLGVLAIASFAMLFRLGDRPIENWDEGIHGAVSVDMVERGDWVTPWYAGGPYFRKPPLKLWMTAALMKVLPTPSNSPSRWEGEKAITWALRLPNAVAGILTSLLVAWWMWQWRRSRLEAFLAGVIVATMRPIFFHAFRTGEMDGLLTLFVTGALYCWWKAVQCAAVPIHETRNPKPEIRNKLKFPKFEFWTLFRISKFVLRVSRRGWWLALCGATIGLAVMTKSAAGLLPVPIIAVHALLTGGWRCFRFREFFILTSSFFILVAPWHLAMTALHGATFWNDYFGWHIVKRATEAIHNPTAGIWWYLPTLMRKFSPYAWWFVPALVYSLSEIVRAWQQQRKPVPDHSSFIIHHSSFSTQTLLLPWFLVTIALFTAAKTKFDWYLLPLYPAAAMLLATFLTAARDVTRNRTTAALHLAALVIAVLALPSLYPDGSTLDRTIAHAYRPFGHPIVLAGIAIAMVVGAIAITHRRWGAGAAGRVAQVLVLFLVLVPGFVVTASHLIRTTPPGPFPSIAAEVRGTGGHLVSYGMDYKQHPAGYFILRGALSGDARVLDGRRRDVARTIAMLREREHGFLLTQSETELPEELHQVVGDPRTFGDFTLWERR